MNHDYNNSKKQNTKQKGNAWEKKLHFANIL